MTTKRYSYNEKFGYLLKLVGKVVRYQRIFYLQAIRMNAVSVILKETPLEKFLICIRGRMSLLIVSMSNQISIEP